MIKFNLICKSCNTSLTGFSEWFSNKQCCDVVLINIGEGIRRDPEFMVRLNKESYSINSSNACTLFDRSSYRKNIWFGVNQYISKEKKQQ